MGAAPGRRTIDQDPNFCRGAAMADTAMSEAARAWPGSGGARHSHPADATATAQVTTTSTVAAGVFAAGHLGELTQQVPFELVDAVLEQTRATQQRLRELPSRVGVYFVLALGLFPALGYRKVWGKLVAGLRGLGVPCPSDKALRDLRRRLGPAPVKALFEVLAGPVAGPRTPGVRFGRYRTVAFDGCTSIKVADSDRNRAWLGKLRAALGVTGYPAVELMTLVETDTRALLGAVFGPPAVGGRPTTPAGFSGCSGRTCWCWPIAASTPPSSSPSWPPPAPATWSGCAATVACPCWRAARTARCCLAWARTGYGSSAPTSPSPAPMAPDTPPPTG